jgi:hypothetical protein
MKDSIGCDLGWASITSRAAPGSVGIIMSALWLRPITTWLAMVVMWKDCPFHQLDGQVSHPNRVSFQRAIAYSQAVSQRL